MLKAWRGHTTYFVGTERTYGIPKGADSTHGVPYRHGGNTRSIPILFTSCSFAESN